MLIPDEADWINSKILYIYFNLFQVILVNDEASHYFIYLKFKLSITSKTNVKSVKFLDVTLNLNTRTYKLYNKPN